VVEVVGWHPKWGWGKACPQVASVAPQAQVREVVAAGEPGAPVVVEVGQQTYSRQPKDSMGGLPHPRGMPQPMGSIGLLESDKTGMTIGHQQSSIHIAYKTSSTPFNSLLR
jgi:hypothetical protein